MIWQKIEKEYDFLSVPQTELELKSFAKKMALNWLLNRVYKLQ